MIPNNNSKHFLLSYGSYIVDTAYLYSISVFKSTDLGHFWLYPYYLEIHFLISVSKDVFNVSYLMKRNTVFQEEFCNPTSFCNVSQKTFLFVSDISRFVINSILMIAFAAMCLLGLDINNVSEFTEIGCSVLEMISIYVKFVILYTHRSKIQQMVRSIQQRCFDLSERFPEESSLLQQCERRLRIISVCFITLAGSVGVAWVALPLVRNVMYGKKNLHNSC